MRVIVSQPHVGMPVRVRLRHRFLVRVLMVLIVGVQMLMLDRLMRVEVPMVLANQCGNAHHHESARDEREGAWAVAEKGNRHQRPDEGSGREDRALPCGS